jgi:hypothetical protein
MSDKSERNGTSGGGMPLGEETTSHESFPPDETDRNVAVAPAASNKRKLSKDDSPMASGSDEVHPSGPANKKSRRAQAADAATTESATEFPLIPLLNSRFFFGTSLSLVNREAYQHTKTLAQHANKIKRFLGKRCPPQMYYDMYFNRSNEGHGHATNAGPGVLNENNLDVFMVAIRSYDFRATDRGPTRHSLRALAENIQSWWQSVGRHRLTTHSPDAYHLPSGRLVDFSPGGNQFIPRLHLRGAVIRGYMKYNNLWRSAAPLFQTNNFLWCIVTADEPEKYGRRQNGNGAVEVYRNEQSYIQAVENGYR